MKRPRRLPRHPSDRFSQRWIHETEERIDRGEKSVRDDVEEFEGRGKDEWMR